MTVVPTEGTHIVFDCWGCDPEVLADHTKILEALRAGAEAAGATVIHAHAHDFDGDGVSAILILQESHASSHGWPSKGFASFDVYTCGDSDPMRALDVIVDAVGASRASVALIARGTSEGLKPRVFTVERRYDSGVKAAA